MKASLANLLDIAIETEDTDEIATACHAVLRHNPPPSWDSIKTILMEIVEEKLELGPIMESPLNVLSLVTMIESIAKRLTLEPEGDDLEQDDEDDDDDEEDDDDDDEEEEEESVSIKRHKGGE